MRDYLDTVVLLERLGEQAARRAFERLDEVYHQPNGTSVLVEVIERLGEAAPSDAPQVDLASYKHLSAPWNDWEYLRSRGRHWAQVLAPVALAPGSEGP